MKDKKNMPTWFPNLINKLEKEGNKKTVYTSKKDPSLSMEVNDKGDIKVEHISEGPIVYVIQELPGTSIGRPKFNIMGALKYGKLKVLLKENTQIVLSPGPIVFELRRLLKDYTSQDYLLLSGDPAVILLAGMIASDINNGKVNVLKWDRQEKVYYPLEINLHERGDIDE